MNKRLGQLVFDILKEQPETRNSDKALYIAVCRKVVPDLVDLPFAAVYGNKRFPVAETVRRYRQKHQEYFPELAADVNVQAARELEEQEYREEFTGYDGRRLDKYT